MKYVILIYSNPRSRHVWDDMTDQQRLQFGRDHMTFTQHLAETGELVHSEGLVDPQYAKRVWLDDGETMTTDGPFAEVKEYLAGFYIVDTPTIDRAVEHAARLPEAAYTYVEVRPVFDPTILDTMEHAIATEHENPVEKVEEKIRETVGQAEEAAWETAYEARDMAEDAIDTITHPRHKHHEQNAE
jgi:hypothetical protein